MVLRTARTGTDLKIYDLCKDVVLETGLELYDLDFNDKSKDLKIYIQNAEGTAELTDCIKVDRALSPYFETEEWMPSEITLEVSSPGLFRDLTEVEHFENVVGENIKITTKRPLESCVEIDGKRFLKGKKFVGKLSSLGEDKGTINIEIKDVLINLSFEDIKKASLETAL
jgi:ribosome maturation factor RimP